MKISRSVSRPPNAGIGSRAIQEAMSASERGSRRLARMLCWPQRQVMASIRLGAQALARAQAASPTAAWTASTSLPSMRTPGMS